MKGTRLKDVLDDKVLDHKFWNGIFAKMNTLLVAMETAKGNYDIDDIEIRYLESLLETLSENPSHRLTADNMKKCNQLWRKYKNV